MIAIKRLRFRMILLKIVGSLTFIFDSSIRKDNYFFRAISENRAVKTVSWNLLIVLEPNIVFCRPYYNATTDALNFMFWLYLFSCGHEWMIQQLRHPWFSCVTCFNSLCAVTYLYSCFFEKWHNDPAGEGSGRPEAGAGLGVQHYGKFIFGDFESRHGFRSKTKKTFFLYVLVIYLSGS
jgi:hypothetical protein